jgi:pimeloyl-ACP methyl ester carboxylesterase
MPSAAVDGYDIHYRDHGEGPVALLVHGFPLDSTVWLDQVDALADIRRLVAPDLRGFGRSGPASGVLSMERHADDLAAICDHIEVPSVDLAGLSMGGYVALAFAERHPERLRSLALIDTKAAADDERAKANRDMMAVRVVVEGREALADEMMEALLAPGASLPAKGRLRTMVESTPVETIVAALEAMKARPDRTSVVASFTGPLTAIVGEHDRLTTQADAEAMVSAVLGSVVTVIRGAGHLTPIESAADVTAALRRFWS